ncbi:hypothetical protein ACQ4XT_15670 [Halobacillus faecis]
MEAYLQLSKLEKIKWEWIYIKREGAPDHKEWSEWSAFRMNILLL